MVDPLLACADLSEKHGTWFHVDAAWGGGLIACPNASKALNGIQRADSITIDAHKWFATTMGTGIFFTSRPDVLGGVFRVSASYMPESDSSKDYYSNSMQWSRRFIGLKMFLALCSAGWNGFAEHVNTLQMMFKRLAEANLIQRGRPSSKLGIGSH